MCGLIGTIGYRDVASFPRLMKMLEHRGPDGSGSLGWSRGRLTYDDHGRVDGRVLLGHRRLAVLDVSDSAAQPMSMEDGSLHIVYNGEIYNYKELREELKNEGYVFSSSGDTEVLLKAWHHWGPDSLPRLKGMFAAAILDARECELYVIRDFFGIKPLYWTKWSDGFAFASEINPLLELSGVKRRLNAQTVYDYLQFGVTELGDGSFVEQIQHLPPAHWMRVNAETLSIDGPTPFWTLSPSTVGIDYREAVEHLKALFLENVRLHLRSDVPLGAALSGGIDSSAIVCGIRAVNPDNPLRTFSFIAGDPRLSEEHWVDVAATEAATEVHKIHIEPGELQADLPSLVARQGEPFASTSIYAQSRVFAQARAAGIKVMLDGQGADELLAGYNSFRAARIADLLSDFSLAEGFRLFQRSIVGGDLTTAMLVQLVGMKLLGPAARRFSRSLVGRPLEPEWLEIGWFRDRGTEIRDLGGGDDFSGTMLQALRENPLPMLLRYEDRNSMAVSIESRVPFLTTDFAEFVVSLPPEWLIDTAGDTKAIFREAMRGLVPDSILSRRDKKGFPTPEMDWLTGGALNVDDLISEAGSLPFFREKELAFQRARFEQGKSALSSSMLWRWINMLLWCQEFDLFD